MSNFKKEIKDIVKMATAYDVGNNSLFLSVLDTYIAQKKAIDRLQAAISSEELTIDKEYVKGRKNQYIHPAIKELPRHAEAINKTASQLIDIITKLGQKEGGTDSLMEFIRK